MSLIDTNARRFMKQFAPLFVAVLICITSITFVLMQGEKDISRTGNWVEHSYQVVSHMEHLSTRIESMMSNQRAYFLSGKKSYVDAYEKDRIAIGETIDVITHLTSDNPAQVARVAELRQKFSDLSKILEERVHKLKPKSPERVFLSLVDDATSRKNNILTLAETMQEEEYALLSRRLQLVDDKKSQYFQLLIFGLLASAFLVLFFNYLFYRIHLGKETAEAALSEMEQRYAMVLDGTNDGIFDRDFTTGLVFYSRQYFKMLGIDRPAYFGAWEDSFNLIHPDDRQKKNEILDQYIKGSISDYSNVFRMRHADGHWVWVQSRSKGIFDDQGNILRLVGAHTDITADKAHQEMLERQKQQAEESSRAKSDFLAQMSHEIRTPLTAISGIAEIFQYNMGNLDDKQKKLIRTLHASTSTLKDIVNDVLDFSKIESGELELDVKTFPLHELFMQLRDIMSVRAAEKGLELKVNADSLVDVDFVGDSTRLRQILINLAGNATKFTSAGGVYIDAGVTEEGGQKFLHVAVRDTGIGIAPEKLDVIFERFKQGDASVSRRYGGTGLGLSISLNLARLMGGDIVVDSALGKGSTFTVILPFRDGELALSAGYSEMVNKKLNEKIRAANSGDKRILVVEDYEGNIVVLGYLLDDLGCKYDIARNGIEGVSKWREHYYDIVLMDVQMPEMDGLTATAEIRRLEREKSLPRTPIIGMTAHALVEDKNKCIEAGMDAYLPKPLVEADLKTEILRYLNRRTAA